VGEAASAAKGAVGAAAESGWQPASAAGCVHACMHYCVPAVPAGIRSCLAPNFAAAF
jgi:hypothetical protein